MLQRLLYSSCSLSCYKIHKNSPNCTPPKKENQAETSTPSEFTCTEDTVLEEKLKLLQDNEKLKTLLKNPHLQNMMRDVDSAPNAELAMQKAMLEPIFVEMAEECLKVVEPRDNT